MPDHENAEVKKADRQIERICIKFLNLLRSSVGKFEICWRPHPLSELFDITRAIWNSYVLCYGPGLQCITCNLRERITWQIIIEAMREVCTRKAAIGKSMSPAKIPNARPRKIVCKAEPHQIHPALEGKRVFGMGSCGLDYLAQVASWPKPDDKLRTESLETQGGGNCANALTAASRLGLPVSLISKIGDDGIGEQIVSELYDDHISTEYLIRAKNSPSPFTYIIVDRTGGTRTCIHTPSEPLDPTELQNKHSEIVEKASLIYFDGRLTEAAVELARCARKSGIPVLVEAERLRPNLEQLLPEADFVTTSSHFPEAWTGEEDLGDALIEILLRLPNASWCFTTLGAQGALLVQRQKSYGKEPQNASLSDVISNLKEKLSSDKTSGENEPAILNEQIREGEVVSSEVYSFTKSQGQSSAAKDRAKQAAQDEAHRNAGGGKFEAYSMASENSEGNSGDLTARVFLASAAQIPKEAIRDTTGAGDATVGSFLYGLSLGMEIPKIMKLAAIVSARKCTDFGARSALPKANQIRPDLLQC